MQLQYTQINVDNADAFQGYIVPNVYQEMWERPGYLALGAVWEEKACGAVVTSREGSKAMLESIYIDPAARRKKLGTMLLQQSLVRLQEEGCSQVEVLYSFAEPDLSVMDRFLQSVWGGKPEKRSATFEITAGELKHTPFYSRFGMGRYSGTAIKTFSELTREQLHALQTDPEIPEVLNCFYRTKYLKLELCRFWVQQDQVKGYILLYEENPKLVSLVAYVKKGSNYGYFPLLGEVARNGFQIYGEDTVIQIDCIGSVSEGLARRMMGNQYCVAYVHRQICELE